MADFVTIFWQISLEIDKFSTDYLSMFYVAHCGDEVSR